MSEVEQHKSKIFRWFERFVNPHDSGKVEIGPLYRLFCIGLLLIIFVFFVDVVLTFRSPENNWHGMFGDFFGGVVNPILTFLTFMGLLITVVMQRIELRETRTELERSATALRDQVSAAQRQSYENTFFKMLESHSGLLETIKFKNEKGDVFFGREAIINICLGFKNNFEHLARPPRDNRSDMKKIFDRKYDRGSIECLRESYSSFWGSFSHVLGHYYNSIFVVLSFVDSKLDGGVYVAMYKSTFSEVEKLLLFYYGLCRADDEFKSLLLKYEMFSDVLDGYIFDDSHFRFSKDLILSNAQYK